MKLSSRTITAIKMFIDLGEHYEEGYISLVDIAKRKELSKKFLEQIVPLYKSNNLLLGNRGNQGGYHLSKAPNQISLKDIVSISELSLEKTSYSDSTISNITDSIDNLLDGYLANMTLDKLIEKEHHKARHVVYAYRLDNVYKSTDNGEPKGTAGRPLLELLLKKDVNNIALIVVRYFGGTKLGASKLLRTYLSSGVEVLKKAGI